MNGAGDFGEGDRSQRGKMYVRVDSLLDIPVARLEKLRDAQYLVWQVGGNATYSGSSGPVGAGEGYELTDCLFLRGSLCRGHLARSRREEVEKGKEEEEEEEEDQSGDM